ncbi:hypothetical protein HHI36_024189 [Cryptolaemus montrouzieri]|uniref:CCDC22 N-terminal domain-containing protein n=1 Tax=Cryptolaemus montrouzieri TaxID=559131 RepID=A0ABD2ND05_9CUCU
MDEVDNIIIDSLKALNCDIPEGINNLKQFNDDLVILSVSTCLEKIIPSSIFPKKLSPSMAVRLKAASHLAEQIKDIGFKDEIGYQTLLYFNEVEIRRLLIFLIEKLPRDSETSIQTEEVGYISKLLIDLELKLKHFPSLWVSSNDLNRGVNLCEDVIEVRSYGNSSNMRVKNLKISSDGNNSGDRDYFIHILPTVTKQCAPMN